MGRKLSDIESSARDILRDEFVEGVDLDWEPDELRRLIRLTLDEMEQKMPYEVKATTEDALSTVASHADSVTTSATATLLVVASDDDFPTTYPFYITIENEVLSVTALASADNFTVTRGQKDSTAAIHAVGKNVALTLVTTEDEKDIDLSGIVDIIRVQRCEFRISHPSKNPRQFRGFSIFGDTLTMDINFLPSANEEVHLYLHKKHTLTDKTSTLKSQHETVLIQGVTARAAMNKGREQINALNVGGVNVGERMVAWGREQLGLYFGALRHHAVKNTYETLPRD